MKYFVGMGSEEIIEDQRSRRRFYKLSPWLFVFLILTIIGNRLLVTGIPV